MFNISSIGSFKTLKSKFNKMEWWQKIVVVIVGLYVVKYLIDALKLTAAIGAVVALKDQVSQLTGGAETFEGESSESDSTLTCTMYYTTWCGYCKKAKPHWEKLTNLFNGKTVNGKKIFITKIDCEKYPELAKQQGIEGYPTFKFDLNGKYFDYNGGHSLDDFKQFVTSIVHADSA
jgi:thiol-disulfide isomerase/thioredoxin